MRLLIRELISLITKLITYSQVIMLIFMCILAPIYIFVMVKKTKYNVANIEGKLEKLYQNTSERFSKWLKQSVIVLVLLTIIKAFLEEPIITIIYDYLLRYKEFVLLSVGALISSSIGLVSNYITNKRNRKSSINKDGLMLKYDLLNIERQVKGIADDSHNSKPILKSISYDSEWKERFSLVSQFLVYEHYDYLQKLYGLVEDYNDSLNKIGMINKISKLDALYMYIEVDKTNNSFNEISYENILLDLDKASENKNPKSTVVQILEALWYILIVEKYRKRIEAIIKKYIDAEYNDINFISIKIINDKLVHFSKLIEYKKTLRIIYDVAETSKVFCLDDNIVKYK